MAKCILQSSLLEPSSEKIKLRILNVELNGVDVAFELCMISLKRRLF